MNQRDVEFRQLRQKRNANAVLKVRILLLINFDFSYLNFHKKIRAEILLDSKKTTKLGKFGFMSTVFGKFRSLISRREITFIKSLFFMFLGAKCSG